MGTIRAAGNGVRGHLIGRVHKPKADGSPEPNPVAELQASVHYYRDTDTRILHNSLTFAVPRDWWYVVGKQDTAGVCEISAFKARA